MSFNASSRQLDENCLIFLFNGIDVDLPVIRENKCRQCLDFCVSDDNESVAYRLNCM